MRAIKDMKDKRMEVCGEREGGSDQSIKLNHCRLRLSRRPRLTHKRLNSTESPFSNPDYAIESGKPFFFQFQSPHLGIVSWCLSAIGADCKLTRFG